MKGILSKTENGWVVNYHFSVKNNDYETLPLHPDFIEMMDTCFTSKFTRDVEFDIVSEWENGEVGVNGLTYAKLIHHSVDTTKMINHIVEANEMVDQVPDVRKMVEEYGATCNQLYKEWLKLGFEAGYNKAKDVLVNNRSGALTNISGAVSTKGGAVSVVEDDVEKLAEEFKNQYIKVGVTEDEVSAFIVGYLKAKETLYTEEQVREAIRMAQTRKYNSHFYNADEIIQSLKQPKQ